MSESEYRQKIANTMENTIFSARLRSERMGETSLTADFFLFMRAPPQYSTAGIFSISHRTSMMNGTPMQVKNSPAADTML